MIARASGFVRPVETGGYNSTKSAFADCGSGIFPRGDLRRGRRSGMDGMMEKTVAI
jgi:hypothetical protein